MSGVKLVPELADPDDLVLDDGLPDSASVCGFADDVVVCEATAAYTAWLGGVQGFDPEHVEAGVPFALCTGHGEVVRRWPELIRMHTVRAAGTAAPWVDWNLA